VWSNGNKKKYEDNLYYALKADDLELDLEENNDGYKYQKNGP